MKQYTIIAILLMIAVLELPALEKTAYTVQIENADKGKITVPVPKLELGQYQTNEIFIKTKEVESFDERGFISPLMQNAFDNITINKLNKISKNVNKDQKINKLPVNRLYKVNYQEPVDAYDLCQELMKNPAVEYAVPVFNRYTYEYTPDDPSLHAQWYLENINAEKAWEITKGSEDIIIGIVDSGTDWEHVDLADNMYVNEDEIAFNGVDDDGNGYVDDVNGWDFVGNVSFNQILQGQFSEDNNPKPQGNSEHGTHVAGCASAATDNGRGIAGIGFNTKLLAVKCASDQNNVRGIYRSYEGILYAAENGADIVNCSWGGPGYNPAEQEIINSVVGMGVLVVASAGNSGVDLESGQFYPASYNNILCVGSTRNNNTRAPHSNWGYRVDVYSPGQGILSTVLNDKYSNNTGTSMAGPIVAGVAALVKAVHPDWLPHQIASQIRSTSMPLSNVSDAQKPLFYGRVNAFDAVSANANDFSSKRRLGMGVSESDFAEGEILNSYESNEITLKLVNYLAPVQGVRLTFTPLDKFIDIKTDEIILNNLSTMDTTDVKVEMDLTDMTPWFDGQARVLIKYSAPGYEDYQLLKIPVRLPSNNRHSVLRRFPEGLESEFHHIHSPDINSYWAVGRTGSNQGIIYNSTSKQLFVASNQMATGVYALSSSEAWVTTGSVNGNTAEIKYTSNGGSNWVNTDVSDETNFLNGIHFFDEENGIAFGDPQGGSHCLLITEDGGDNWTRNSNVSPISDENGLVGSFGAFGDYIWIGTTQGRVLKGHKDISSWRVNSLEEASTVIDIAFESEKKGLAIYSLHSNNEILLARSTDGGLNWKENQLNFSEEMNIDPVSIIYNEDVDRIFIICKRGEIYYTDDLGDTWIPVLNRNSVAFQRGTISNDFDKFKMYGIGEAGFASLGFTMIPEGAEAHLQVQQGDEVVFDDTEAGKTSLKNFDLVNSGDITVLIDSVYLTGDDAGNFAFFGNTPTEISRDGSAKVIVRFEPDEEREYNAQVVITSNNADGDISVNLSGTGVKKVFSVPLTYINSIQTYPNPVKNEVNIEFTSDLSKMLEWSLVDNNGKTIKNIGKQVINEGSNQFKIDTENLISGTYFILFESEDGSFVQKIIKE